MDQIFLRKAHTLIWALRNLLSYREVIVICPWYDREL